MRKPMSEETKLKISLAKRGNPSGPKGQHWTRKTPVWNKGELIYRLCIYPKCHNYIVTQPSLTRVKYCSRSHGRGPAKVDAKYSRAFVKIRPIIKERDGFKCTICGIIEGEVIKLPKGRLEIHHLDHNPDNLASTNLVTLCSSCHQSGHRKGNL